MVVSLHQRLRLSQRIGQQQSMVLGPIVSFLTHGDEFHRDDLRALAQQLEKRMLPVAARLPPDCRRRRPARLAAMPHDAFAVALHFKLLQIGRQTLQVGMIRGNATTAVMQQAAFLDLHQPHE